MDYKQKRQTIEALLDHLEDFYLPSPSGVSSGDGESIGVAFVSGMSRYPSVVELARCLGMLKKAGEYRRGPCPECGQRACAEHPKEPVHFNHLCGFYRSEWRTTDRPIRKRTQSGKTVLDVERVRLRVVPRWVEPGLVDRATDFLVCVWDFRVVLELPPALNRKLREMTDHEGTHLTEAA